jgi:hypothetical protein
MYVIQVIFYSALFGKSFLYFREMKQGAPVLVDSKIRAQVYEYKTEALREKLKYFRRRSGVRVVPL